MVGSLSVPVVVSYGNPVTYTVGWRRVTQLGSTCPVMVGPLSYKASKSVIVVLDLLCVSSRRFLNE